MNHSCLTKRSNKYNMFFFSPYDLTIFRPLCCASSQFGLFILGAAQVKRYLVNLGLWYCWWLKSYTTWDVWNPINNGIFSISTGAGFQPSTVVGRVAVVVSTRGSLYEWHQPKEYVFKTIFFLRPHFGWNLCYADIRHSPILGYAGQHPELETWHYGQITQNYHTFLLFD